MSATTAENCLSRRFENEIVSARGVRGLVHGRGAGQLSSVVEQRFCKPSVVGSIPTAGSINRIRGFMRVVTCRE